jgi:ribose transport system permease protein
MATKRWADFISLYGSLLVVIIITALFCLFARKFAGWENIQNIMVQTAIVGLTSLGLVTVMMAGEIDLSMGGTIGFTGALLAGLVMQQGYSLFSALGVCILVGAAFGFINGWLVARYGLSSFLVTVSTMFISMGLERAYTHGLTVWIRKRPDVLFLAQGKIAGLPVFMVILLAAVVIYWLWQTQFNSGIYIRAIGENIDAAREAGIRVVFLKTVAFIISGAFFGFSGALNAIRTSGNVLYSGQHVWIPVLGACFFGATMFTRGKPNILGAVVGSFFFTIILNGLTLTHVAFYMVPIVQGLILIGAVGVTAMRRKELEQVKF